MATEEKKGKCAGPVFTVLALAGIAGMAYLAYRRVADRGEVKVGNLMDMADKASRALEKRLDDYAIAS